jgi:hypothetical protein
VNDRHVAYRGKLRCLPTEMTAHGTNSLEINLGLYWPDVHLPDTSVQNSPSVSHVVLGAPNDYVCSVGQLAMVASTVSSKMIEAMAHKEGFKFVECLTGARSRYCTR